MPSRTPWLSAWFPVVLAAPLVAQRASPVERQLCLLGRRPRELGLGLRGDGHRDASASRSERPAILSSAAALGRAAARRPARDPAAGRDRESYRPPAARPAQHRT